MKLWNVPAESLRQIVTEVSDTLYDGNIRFKREPEKAGRALRFTLTVATSKAKGGRRSSSGRRVCACCWHGHRDIMQHIFNGYEDARLQTAQADYKGRADFEASFPSTGDVNIGSQMEPMAFSDACDCDA